MIDFQDGEVLQPVGGNYEISETLSSDTDWYTCVCENPEGNVTQSVFLDVYSKYMSESDRDYKGIPFTKGIDLFGILKKLLSLYNFILVQLLKKQLLLNM